MKTLLSIAVGLMLLFSNAMVLAAPTQKTFPVSYFVTIHGPTPVVIRIASATDPALLQQLPATITRQQSFTTNMRPGTFHFAYGDDSNHYCQFQLVMSSDGLSSASTSATQNMKKCQITMSGKNNVNIVIKPIPMSGGGETMEGSPGKVYRIHIQNDAILQVPAIVRLPLVFHQYSFQPAPSSNYAPYIPPLPDIKGEGASQGISVRLYYGTLNLSYGISANSFCQFKIVYDKTRGVEASAIPDANNIHGITCDAGVGSNSILLTVGAPTKWLPSALCVKNSSNNAFYVKFLSDDNVFSSYIKIHIDHSVCRNYYKNMNMSLVGVWGGDENAVERGLSGDKRKFRDDRDFAINSIQNGVIQAGLITRVIVTSYSTDGLSIICHFDYPIPLPTNYRPGNHPATGC